MCPLCNRLAKANQSRNKDDCNRETLQVCSVIESSPTIYRLVHCIHTTYSMQKHCQKRNYVQNHINININIILLYGILDNSLIWYVRRLRLRGTPQFSNLIRVADGGQGQGHREQLSSCLPPLAPPMLQCIKCNYDLISLNCSLSSE